MALSPISCAIFHRKADVTDDSANFFLLTNFAFITMPDHGAGVAQSTREMRLIDVTAAAIPTQKSVTHGQSGSRCDGLRHSDPP